jgi:hypothetical protein
MWRRKMGRMRSGEDIRVGGANGGGSGGGVWLGLTLTAPLRPAPFIPPLNPDVDVG